MFSFGMSLSIFFLILLNIRLKHLLHFTSVQHAHFLCTLWGPVTEKTFLVWRSNLADFYEFIAPNLGDSERLGHSLIFRGIMSMYLKKLEYILLYSLGLYFCDICTNPALYFQAKILQTHTKLFFFLNTNATAVKLPNILH